MLGKYCFKMFVKILNHIIFLFKRKNVTFNPVFIIGCGRSGTTILGTILSKHPEIKYLNEKRDLWHKAYPEFDIWSGKQEMPKLFADKANVDFEKISLLKKLFFREQVLGNSKILLEKLPINNFRLEFLNHVFPNAKYIYLTRNGLEVSKSIERKIKKNNWFTGKKLELLKEFSTQKNINFTCEIKTDLEKGMWEWKLSMHESDLFFKKLNSETFTHLSYQDFIENTESSLEQIFSFLNLTYSNNLITELSKDISRKNKSIDSTDDEILKKIGGEILTKTINNNYSPF